MTVQKAHSKALLLIALHAFPDRRAGHVNPSEQLMRLNMLLGMTLYAQGAHRTAWVAGLARMCL